MIKLTPELFTKVLARLPKDLERIEMHPYQLQAYEEAGFANFTPDFTVGKMPGFDGVPFPIDEPFTIGGIAVRGNRQLPKDTVKFIANGKIVGEINNVAEPVFE